MALLGRSGFVVPEDLVDERAKLTQLGRAAISDRRAGLRMLESLANGVAGMIEIPGDLPDGFSIAARPSNGAVIVHREHFLASMQASDSV